MSADRVDRTGAVTIGLAKRDPTNQKSVHERLKSMWQMGFREDRNVSGPSQSDTSRHDPSNKTRPDQGGSKFTRDLEKYGRWASKRVEMSADRVDRTRAVTTRLTKLDSTNRKSVRERLRKIWQMGFREGRNVGGPSRSDTGRHHPSNKRRPDKPEVSSRET